METTSNIQPVEATNLTPEVNPGFFSSMFTKLMANKTYLYIGIAVIVLGIALYYYFYKFKKSTAVAPEPTKSTETKVTEKPEIVPVTSDPEYYILDANGNKIKVSGSYVQQLQPLPVQQQQPSQQEIMLLQQQMLEQQRLEQQRLEELNRQKLLQQKRQLAHIQEQKSRKLQHASENSSDEEINAHLERIHANEDSNVAEHNLTHSEIAELTSKLEMMNSQNN